MGSQDTVIIDCLQYANFSEKIFREMAEGGVSAVHVTICYHENFRETVLNIEAWNRRFEAHGDLIMPGRSADDVIRAQSEGRTAIFFGFQNCSPIEDDIGLVEICHGLGARFMQLSYNNQSLLATGCYEAQDPGITRMGRQVIAEMNRVGLVVDMSHSAERSTLEAIEISERPIAITHANPHSWHPALRNKSDEVLSALAQSGGMIGLSLYPHHLADGTDCTLTGFCDMVARLADLIGVSSIGIGSDLCQDQPDSVVEWMRNGRWTNARDYGEGSAKQAGFPTQPEWFRDNRDFSTVAQGLAAAGFSADDVARIMGGNWLNFFEKSFGP
ncbi:MAG: membrane dipeptidase [Alphaproteobacteria bacterium]|jgi:microsomal dipeptidase-like Zn-dependent dipeptidase